MCFLSKAPIKIYFKKSLLLGLFKKNLNIPKGQSYTVNGQYDGQKKKDKSTNNTLHRKLKIPQHEQH